MGCHYIYEHAFTSGSSLFHFDLITLQGNGQQRFVAMAVGPGQGPPTNWLKSKIQDLASWCQKPIAYSLYFLAMSEFQICDFESVIQMCCRHISGPIYFHLQIRRMTNQTRAKSHKPLLELPTRTGSSNNNLYSGMQQLLDSNLQFLACKLALDTPNQRCYFISNKDTFLLADISNLYYNLVKK